MFTVAVGKKKVPFVVTIPPPTSSNATAAPIGNRFQRRHRGFWRRPFYILPPRTEQFRDGKQTDGTGAVLHVDNSAVPTAATGAVYKGLAIATLNGHQFIYATNFRSGNVDVFDSSYNPVTSLTGTFTDPNPIAGFAPFGITLFGTSNLWVTYAMQDAAKHDPVHQVGAGYIDIFTTDGVFVERFATGGNLNAPWGMVLHAVDLRSVGR